MRVHLESLEQMRTFAAALADHLCAGDLLILTGNLGAGKTTFTQSLGKALDVTGRITSPTFVIAREHLSRTGGPALVHVDAYRLFGEEGPGGAEPMVKDGVMEDVDAIFAQHIGNLFSGDRERTVDVTWAESTAADDQVIIHITGLGGHGANPHKCVDPVVIAAQIIQNLQYIVSRETDPYDSVVITIASVEAGRAPST